MSLYNISQKADKMKKEKKGRQAPCSRSKSSSQPLKTPVRPFTPILQACNPQVTFAQSVISPPTIFSSPNSIALVSDSEGTESTPFLPTPPPKKKNMPATAHCHTLSDVNSTNSKLPGHPHGITLWSRSGFSFYFPRMECFSGDFLLLLRY